MMGDEEENCGCTFLMVLRTVKIEIFLPGILYVN